MRKIRQRQTLAATKEQVLLDKRHSVCRGVFRILQLSKETRVAFRLAVAAQQRRSFLRHGQCFLDELAKDIWSCPHGVGYRENRSCSCSGKGGWVGAPHLEISEERETGALGRWQRSLLAGNKLMINWYADRPSTLIHECTHWIDSFSDLKDSHTARFYVRVRDLARRLSYRGEVE